ncbi:MAG: oxidoreductase [Candidatus Bathyarchaeota archaeon B63]|nr:MAG: oxidoreductase [Candidatus Bathyarchaeota archaeon B63]
MAMTLDLSGLVCPVPLVRSRKAMENMEPGDVLEIIVDSEDSRVNILMAAKELSLEIKRATRDAEGRWHIIVRKG